MKGKTIALTALLMLAPSIIKDRYKPAPSIRAEKTRIEYLIEWPISKVYRITLNETDNIDAIIQSTLIGLKKYNLGRTKQLYSGINAKKVIELDIQNCLKEKNSWYDIVAYKMRVMDYLDSLKDLGLKEDIEECKKDIAEDYYPMMKRLEGFIGKQKDPYIRHQLIEMRDNINDKIKMEKIALKKAL